MEKLKLQSADMAERNIEMLGQMFPDCLTEAVNDYGKVVRAIDFDKLRQELSCEVVEGAAERYQFTWPDKRKAIRMANAPTTKTLRPCREESVDFDNTENLYIEGDNLEVLKLLRENYLGKVKMIYIDPPYNTGNDFVYNDDFRIRNDEFVSQSGLFDEDDRRLVDPMVQNTESNGRFHTDWLNMIYPRLKVAKDLLSDDGVIFISIDDNEVGNLRKVCDEIFGDVNYLSSLIWNKQHSQQQGVFKKYHETILVYAKSAYNISNISGGSGVIEAGAQKKISKANPASEFTFPKGVRFDAPNGTIIEGTYGDAEKSTITKGRLQAFDGVTTEEVSISAGWTQKNQMIAFFKGKTVYDTKGQLVTSFYFNSAGKLKCTKERSKITPPSILPQYGMVSEQTTALDMLMDGHYFDMPKPVNMMIDFARWFSNDSDIVLDFFSGSATTAHAVMQLNAEDGGKRKFIMVQLPERTDEKSEAYKAGYKNICEIGKERIRRAGKKILNELGVRNDELGIENGNDKLGVGNGDNSKLDIGFRVLKLDESNMKDVYYTPAETPIDAQQEMAFDSLVDNIREGRTAEDLLFQVLPECNLPLSSKIEERELYGKRVFVVNDGYLVACFDIDINEAVITAIAKQRPYYFVMCDRSMATDNVADNFDQIFDAYSKETIRRVL